MKLLTTTVTLAGVVPAFVALAALVGLGVVRSLPIPEIGLTAAMLVVLPIAGLYLVLGRSPLGLGAAMWVWPCLVMAAVPGYFPGELNEALGAGFGVFFALGGQDATASAARFGRTLQLPTSDATPRPPEAARPTEPCIPAATPLAGDQVALPYEGQGHSMAVPVQFGDTELSMLFDTGASVTTLGADTLARLGVRVPADAPEITLRTANGERTARIVLIPRVWVGGLPVDGVSVGVCEECADEHTAGLLGLNVSGQYLVTVDTARKEVVFQARSGRQDRVVDIAPWLKVHATAKVWPDERVEVEVVAENHAARTVTEAVAGIHCGADDFVATLADIQPGESVSTTARLPAGTKCDEYRVTLDHAYW